MAIKPCNDCGRDVSASARSCPNCGAKRSMDPRTRNTLGVVTLIGLLWLSTRLLPGVPHAEVHSSIEPHQPQEMLPLPSISADEFKRSYMENEVAADVRFRNRRFFLMGEVEDIAKDFRDRPYLVLRASGTLLGVHADIRPSELNALVRLRPGEHVRLDCRGAMMVMKRPNAEDCVPVLGTSVRREAPIANPALPDLMESLPTLETVKAAGGSFLRRDSESSWAILAIDIVTDSSMHFDFKSMSGDHIGELEGSAFASGDHWTYVGSDPNPCRLAISFVQHGLVVQQQSTSPACDFGSRVTASGVYTRSTDTTGNEPPTAAATSERLRSQLLVVDSALLQAYRQLLRELSEGHRQAGRDSLVREQRSWIGARDRDCRYNSSGLGFAGVTDSATIHCFVRWTSGRTSELDLRTRKPS